ncbi:PilZ domain-containing protein [Methylophaga sp. OBS1]|uniref:PilZ domain-containing protein n=1 Tax=Methylophaga sp. OBS1 TaxID=2991933 RepID=UPI0022525CED|nr:PilZ domain-containing protein [Methylophaga sp. OBS1]MCX4193470.1 PilZ domain-containing protein [Methylophaga sp. OBS1]
MTDDATQERRRFSRIPFDAIAHIKTADGDEFLNCSVLDVSLKGLLIIKPGQWQARLGQSCTVDLLLQQGEVVIEMHATVAHVDDDSIGFESYEMDLDSITHLKRLMELNLGDEGLLHRELSALIEKD